MPKKKKAKKTKKIKKVKKSKKVKLLDKSKLSSKVADKKNVSLGSDDKPEIKKIKTHGIKLKNIYQKKM